MLKDGSPKKAARLYRKALELAILVNALLRREDVAELDIATDFTCDSKGRLVGLLIPASKSKTGRDVVAAFRADLIKYLDRYRKVYRPILGETGSTYLFPGKIDGHRSPQTIANELKHLVQDQLGIEFNMHLARHLAATMLLDADPRNMSVAQRVLGHTDVKTTERIYGDGRTRGAHREWGDLLDRKVRQLDRRSKP